MRIATLLLAVVLAQPAAAAEPSAPARWYQGAKSWVEGLWNHEAADWLDRIGPALAEQDYQGTLVIVSGTGMDTLGVFHSFQDGHERMRLVAMTGPRREVIRDDQRVTCIGTGLGPAGYDADTVGRWNPGGQFAGAARLSGYKAQLGGIARVANRDAQVIDLQARDPWRYSYRLWLDKQTALPLRIALIGPGGRPLEQIAFTELKIGVRPEENDLRASSEQGLRRIQTLSPGRVVDPGWRVLDPPKGFSLRSARQLGQSVQLLYSDGLANVSVYIEPMATGKVTGESALRRGAVNVHSIARDGRRVVAIGKVPAATTAYFARKAQTTLTATNLQAQH